MLKIHSLLKKNILGEYLSTLKYIAAFEYYFTILFCMTLCSKTSEEFHHKNSVS